jgi:hypothetical protein
MGTEGHGDIGEIGMDPNIFPMSLCPYVPMSLCPYVSISPLPSTMVT